MVYLLIKLKYNILNYVKYQDELTNINRLIRRSNNNDKINNNIIISIAKIFINARIKNERIDNRNKISSQTLKTSISK